MTTIPLPSDAREAAARCARNPHHNRRWWILGVLATAQLMVVLDATVVNIALPTAQRALGFDNGDRQWVVTGYALAFGSLLLLGGRLADLVGRRKVFLIGLAGFAAASAVGGAATGFTMLVTARAVQGGFGALLAPAGLSLLTTTFTEPRDRAKAFGIFGAVGGAGAAVGLLLGGFLTEYASWRWTMYVNLFFAGVAFVGGLLVLRSTHAEDRPHLDWLGAVTAATGLFCLVYGVSHAESAGWNDGVTAGFLVAAVALLLSFVLVQHHVAHPLLPLRVLTDRNRAGALVAMLASAGGMFGVFLFLTYYLQLTQGYSAVRTGLAFLPMVGTLVATSTVVSTQLSGRVSPRVLIPGGLLAAAGGMLILTRITVYTSYADRVLPGTLVVGAGLGLVFATALSTATAGVRPEDAGVASASVNTAQQVGGSIGTALLNTLAASAAASFATEHPSALGLPALAAVHSYVVVFWWSTAIFTGGALAVGLLLRSGVAPAVSSSQNSDVAAAPVRRSVPDVRPGPSTRATV